MKFINSICAVLLPFMLVGCKRGIRSNPAPQKNSRETTAAARLALARDQQLENALVRSQEKNLEQEKSNGRWRTTAILLSAGCIVTLFVGAILGSGAKKNAK